jgi:hypothetical protein
LNEYRNFPNKIRQKEETSEKKIATAKGTLKIAIHTSGTLVVSIYDNKPVHYMSKIDCELDMVLHKAYKVWDAEARVNRVVLEYSNPTQAKENVINRLICINRTGPWGEQR